MPNNLVAISFLSLNENGDLSLSWTSDVAIYTFLEPNFDTNASYTFLWPLWNGWNLPPYTTTLSVTACFKTASTIKLANSISINIY